MLWHGCLGEVCPWKIVPSEGDDVRKNLNGRHVTDIQLCS